MRSISTAGALVALAIAGTAQAAVIQTTFNFTDLNSRYTRNQVGPGGLFQARAANLPELRSSGTVSRTIPTEGTARFNAGFFDPIQSAANFALDIDVSNIVNLPNVSTARGQGTFTITDRNGDRITGNIAGFWIRQISTGQNVYFNGALNSVQYVNSSGDGSFDGPEGGSFSMAYPGGPFFDGSIVELFTNPTPGFFTQSFEGISSQVSGQVVPSAGSLALLGLAGLVAGRRRR